MMLRTYTHYLPSKHSHGARNDKDDDGDNTASGGGASYNTTTDIEWAMEREGRLGYFINEIQQMERRVSQGEFIFQNLSQPRRITCLKLAHFILDDMY